MARALPWLIVVLAFLAPIPVRAGEAEGEASAKKAVDRLKKLSPEQQRVLLERLKRWKSMGEEERARIRENLQTYRALPKNDRRVIEGNLEKWRKKDEAKRGEIQKKHSVWKGLSAQRKDVLMGRYRLVAGLPAKERERIQALPPEKRAAALERLFLAEEVKRLSRLLAPKERAALRNLDLAARKKKALAFLKARREKHLLRMPAELRDKIRALPRKERAQAENRFLRGVYQRDQMLTLLFTPRRRAEFLRQPIEKRDEYAVGFFRREGEKLVKLLSPKARRSVEKAPQASRPQKLLEALFRKRLVQVQANLLPSQRRSLRRLPLSKQWEKTQYFLKVNHRRLLAKLPQKQRAEIQKLAPHLQARRIREILRGELKKAPASHLQRVGIQQLPFLMQWDAIQRLKKRGRKSETASRRNR
jgi:hypothetical protein